MEPDWSYWCRFPRLREAQIRERDGRERDPSGGTKSVRVGVRWG